MSNLKTNWAIRTTDEQFKAYILTLEALGYPIWKGTADGMGDGMQVFTALVDSSGDVCRGSLTKRERDNQFPDISSFLVYHFSSEKTEADKELEVLQEKMNSLQEQIDRVKLSISK